MSDNFQQTVNLRKKIEREKDLRDARGIRWKKNEANSSANEIDRVYGENENESRNNLHKINRPIKQNLNEPLIKKVLFFLVVLVISAVLYWMFIAKNEQNKLNEENKAELNWYSVELINGEIYYGQIDDISADPVVIKNVYGNYDQMEKTVKEESETGNLRLFKRGKETNIVRTSIIEMDPLEEDENLNKEILKAILEDEK